MNKIALFTLLATIVSCKVKEQKIEPRPSEFLNNDNVVRELFLNSKKIVSGKVIDTNNSGVEDVERTLRYMEKVPSLRKWKTDTKTIFSLFGDAAKLSAKEQKFIRIFSKGGLLNT